MVNKWNFNRTYSKGVCRNPATSLRTLHQSSCLSLLTRWSCPSCHTPCEHTDECHMARIQECTVEGRDKEHREGQPHWRTGSTGSALPRRPRGPAYLLLRWHRDVSNELLLAIFPCLLLAAFLIGLWKTNRQAMSRSPVMLAMTPLYQGSPSWPWWHKPAIPHSGSYGKRPASGSCQSKLQKCSCL